MRGAASCAGAAVRPERTADADPSVAGGYNILVRAVDPESAAGLVRALGHEVVGVSEADLDAVLAVAGAIDRPAAIATCYVCRYPLHDLPRGVRRAQGPDTPPTASAPSMRRSRFRDAGVVICPECGAVNTGQEADLILRPRRRMRARLIRAALYGLAVLAAVLAITLGNL